MNGNSARYFNYSCEPNSEYAIVRLDCDEMIVFFVRAKMDNMAGSEITVDYAWGKDSSTPTSVCECNAQTCYGHIGVKI